MPTFILLYDPNGLFNIHEILKKKTIENNQFIHSFHENLNEESLFGEKGMSYNLNVPKVGNKEATLWNGLANIIILEFNQPKEEVINQIKLNNLLTEKIAVARLIIDTTCVTFMYEKGYAVCYSDGQKKIIQQLNHYQKNCGLDERLSGVHKIDDKMAALFDKNELSNMANQLKNHFEDYYFFFKKLKVDDPKLLNIYFSHAWDLIRRACGILEMLNKHNMQSQIIDVGSVMQKFSRHLLSKDLCEDSILSQAITGMISSRMAIAYLENGELDAAENATFSILSLFSNQKIIAHQTQAIIKKRATFYGILTALYVKKQWIKKAVEFFDNSEKIYKKNDISPSSFHIKNCGDIARSYYEMAAELYKKKDYFATSDYCYKAIEFYGKYKMAYQENINKLENFLIILAKKKIDLIKKHPVINDLITETSAKLNLEYTESKIIIKGIECKVPNNVQNFISENRKDKTLSINLNSSIKLDDITSFLKLLKQKKKPEMVKKHFQTFAPMLGEVPIKTTTHLQASTFVETNKQIGITTDNRGSSIPKESTHIRKDQPQLLTASKEKKPGNISQSKENVSPITLEKNITQQKPEQEMYRGYKLFSFYNEHVPKGRFKAFINTDKLKGKDDNLLERSEKVLAREAYIGFFSRNKEGVKPYRYGFKIKAMSDKEVVGKPIEEVINADGSKTTIVEMAEVHNHSEMKRIS